MTNPQLQLLVEYRLLEARETLREAEILLERSAFRGCINRSYYAMFYGEMLEPDRELATGLLERSRFFVGQIQEYLQNWRSEF